MSPHINDPSAKRSLMSPDINDFFREEIVDVAHIDDSFREEIVDVTHINDPSADIVDVALHPYGRAARRRTAVTGSEKAVTVWALVLPSDTVTLQEIRALAVACCRGRASLCAAVVTSRTS